MAIQINTVENILNDLNKDLPAKPWEMMPDVVALTIADVNGQDKITFNSNRGLILRAFINTETAEIRTYLTKLLDQPESKLLP